MGYKEGMQKRGVKLSKMPFSSDPESRNFKNFPGLRPWTPLGGLQRPPNPQLHLTRYARAASCARSDYLQCPPPFIDLASGLIHHQRPENQTGGRYDHEIL